MKRSRIATVLLSGVFLFALSAVAGIREPGIVLYGQVRDEADARVTEGTLEWAFTRDGDAGPSLVLRTELAEIRSDAGTYSYRLNLPLETPLPGHPALSDAIQLSETPAVYHWAAAVPGTGIAADGTMEISYDDCGTYREIYIGVHPQVANEDSDGDGIPDDWETLHGMDADDPDDADDDLDGDGWNGREEFENGGDPAVDNRVPGLGGRPFLAVENGRTRFQVDLLDSDTDAADIDIQVNGIPEGFVLTVFDREADGALRDLEEGEIVTGKEMADGDVLLENTGDNAAAPSISLSIDDGDHAPVSASLLVEIFRPTSTDGTDAVYWADAWNYRQALDADEAEAGVLPDRSGNGYDGVAVSSGTFAFDADPSPSGKAALALDGTGWIELPHAAPVFPDGDSTVISVFRSTGTEMQVLASGPHFDIGVTGADHASHPDEVYGATSTSSVYGNRIATDRWTLSAVRRKDGETRIESNGLWTGGPFFLDGDWQPGTGPVLGANVQRTWNFISQEWEVEASGLFHGQLAEVLVFEEELPESRKWRVDAYLLSKWFGEVVSDFSDAEKPVTVVSGGEQIRWTAKKALYRYIASISAPAEPSAALAALAPFLPEGWTWSSASPGEGEVMQALAQRVPDESYPYYWQMLLPVYRYLAAREPSAFSGALAAFETYLPGGWTWSTTPPGVQEATDAFAGIPMPDYRQVLLGGPFDDRLTGGFANDILVGGPGADRLKGLGGRDLFVVTDGDTVLDLNLAEGDILDLGRLLTRTGKPLGDHLKFETVNDPVYGEYHTLLKIDANGDGSGFDDAAVFLRNIVLGDADLGALWAGGYLQTDGVRPLLEVRLLCVSAQASEVTGEAGEFRVSFSGSPVPADLNLSLGLGGDAVWGQDYHLETLSYNEATGEYETVPAAAVIPVRLKPGDSALPVWVVPVADHVQEPVENVVVTLVPKEEVYDIAADSEIEVAVGDGPDRVSIETVVASVYEEDDNKGEFRITRQGSTNVACLVKLLVMGSAENGRDYQFIPSEVLIPTGQTSVRIFVQPYADVHLEPVEMVEVVVASDAGYAISGPASAMVGIKDGEMPLFCGDLSKNGTVDLLDAVLAVQVCAGNAVSNVHPEMVSNIEERVGVESLTYILQVAAGMRAVTGIE